MKFTGVCIVKMDGQSLRMTDASIMIGGFKREAIYADGKLQGFTETPEASEVKGKLAHNGSSDLIAIRDAQSVTLIFQTDTGKKYTVRAAFCTKPPDLKSGKAECDVEFMGQPAIEA